MQHKSSEAATAGDGLRLSRRQLLKGAGAIGLGLAADAALAGTSSAQMTPGGLAPDSVIKVKSITKIPPAPVGAQSYLTRPDIVAPGVSIEKTSAFNSSYPSYFFLTPKITPGQTGPKGVQQGVMIVDAQGHLVWWANTGGNSLDLNVQTYRGKPVLTYYAGSVNPNGYGDGGSTSCTILDDTYTTIATTGAVPPTGTTESPFYTDLHEFVITPQGTALVTAYAQSTLGSTSIMACHAQEVTIASTPEIIFDWDASQHVGTIASYSRQISGIPLDYFHMNSIALWPGTRDYLISSRNTCAVYLVNHATGAIEWRLGGKYSSFKLGPSVPFWFQHDARPLPTGSGVSLFDDSSQPTPTTQKYASAKVIDLNMSTHRATIKHQLYHTDQWFATPSQGNNQLLSNACRVVGWGAQPYFSVYATNSPTTRSPMVLDGRLPAGVQSYRTRMFNWVGNPSTSEIALVVYHTAGSGNLTAHVSWNGSTEVQSWAVRYGSSSTALSSQTAWRPRAGFETPIPFNSATAAYFQPVAQLKGGGTVLGPVVQAKN